VNKKTGLHFSIKYVYTLIGAGLLEKLKICIVAIQNGEEKDEKMQYAQ
jgi:hypothetical protein